MLFKRFPINRWLKKFGIIRKTPLQLLYQDEELGIIIAAQSYRELGKLLAKELETLYGIYALDYDSNLTKDARKLKNNLLRRIKIVDPNHRPDVDIYTPRVGDKVKIHRETPVLRSLGLSKGTITEVIAYSPKSDKKDYFYLRTTRPGLAHGKDAEPSIQHPFALVHRSNFVIIAEDSYER